MSATENMIQSPLNYTGGKYKLLPQILPLFPENINVFVDLLCGGCNVGINVKANTHVYNDVNARLYNLYTVLEKTEPDDFVSAVYKVISEYGLSLVSEKGYHFYGCDSGSGLSKYNKEKYIALRDDFNRRQDKDMRYYVMLYVLIVYGFNNQIRFNSRHEFNLPVGKRDFNDRMKNKLIKFIEIIREQNAEFSNVDFRKFDYSNLGRDDFVYADPPYLITCATYNEQGGWDDNHEKDLLDTLNMLDKKGVRFALSNVIESKGKKNDILEKWICHNNYNMIELNYNYKNANYHRKDKDSVTREILVINY